MHRRRFIALGSQMVAWLPFAANAQSGRPLPRIGVALSGRASDPQPQEQAAAFQAGLEALGWKDGANVQIEYRWLGDPAHANELAKELVGLSPAVILAGGTINTTALQQATKTIPIVFLNVTDPVAGGFVASLARPGGNITGITPFEYEIGCKWLQLLKEMAPGLKRVALLGDPGNHNFKGFRKSFEDYANKIAVDAVSVAVRSADDLEREIGALSDDGRSGLVVSAATFSITYRDLIVSLAAKRKLPAIYWNRVSVARGGLMSYGPDIVGLFRQSATYIDRILKGAKPEDLAVQTPVKIELIVNGATAKAMGLAIPFSILSSADEIIE